MKHAIPFSNRKYFQQLLCGLLVFIFLLYIPFAFLVLQISRRSILNNINVSNQTVLEQLRQNYKSFSDSIVSLSTSIFWRSDIQNLLYSPSVSYDEMYYTLKNIYVTFVVSHPNLQSISLYNKYSKELYTVTSAGVIDKEEFMDFVSAQDSIVPLQPVLHPMTVRTAMSQSQPMIFSYFMYQFNDPSQINESFLVLNQYSNQVINSINDFPSSSNGISTSVYYVTSGSSVGNGRLSSETEQIHKTLLENFRQKRDSLASEGGFYKDTVQGKHYLISYMNIESSDASLVILQDYDQVFSSLNSLSRIFFVISCLFLLSAIALALLVSRRLYRPIDSAFDFFSQQADLATPFSSQHLNELDVIKSVYQAASERNQHLEIQGDRYAPLALQYGLTSLMLNSDEHSIQHFHRTQPSHWLSAHRDQPLAVVLIQPQMTAQASSEAELPLLLYGVQNIAEELLEPHFLSSCFHYSSDVLGFVIQPKADHWQDVLTSVLDSIRAAVKNYFGISLTAAVSDSTNSIFELSTLLQNATICLSYAFLLGSRVITYDQITTNEQCTQTDYPSELDTALEKAIVDQDLDMCRQILCQIKSVLQMFSVGNAIISTIALLNQVQRISSSHAKSTTLPTTSSFRAVYSYISGNGSIDQCFDAILRYIQMHFSNQGYTSETSDTLFVNTVLEFVQKSYFDINLSSQLIADYLGLNNRYLMKKFKTLTGRTLNEYIVDLRMKKAASLLRDTQTPVSSIAEKVGIDNLSYFYRLFKKVYGCTPGEFREVENT